MSEAKAERLSHANELIRVISKHGRLELDDSGRLRWIDDYRSARVHVAYSGEWRGLIQPLHDYIPRGALLRPD